LLSGLKVISQEWIVTGRHPLLDNISKPRRPNLRSHLAQRKAIGKL